MKIIITESQLNSLMKKNINEDFLNWYGENVDKLIDYLGNLMNKMGFEKFLDKYGNFVEKSFGSIPNFLKKLLGKDVDDDIISESRVHDVIIKYLNQYMYPDYDIGFELHDFYQEDVKKYGSYDFTINDEVAYTYWGEYGGFKNRLEIEGWVFNDLNQKFGKRWIPIFKEWFEEKTGLQVNRMLLPGEY